MKVEKKNLLVLLSSVSGGGAQSLVRAQMKYYNKKKFNVYVVSLRPGSMYESFKRNGNSLFYNA